MAKNERAVGLTKRVGPFTTGHNQDELLIDNGWPGIVVAKITGTTEPEILIGGKPIDGQLGDGLGDIQLEGVFALNDEEPGGLADGDAVDRASASGVKKAADAARPDTGHVFGAPYTDDDGIAKVDVKLLGRPK